MNKFFKVIVIIALFGLIFLLVCVADTIFNGNKAKAMSKSMPKDNNCQTIVIKGKIDNVLKCVIDDTTTCFLFERGIWCKDTSHEKHK